MSDSFYLLLDPILPEFTAEKTAKVLNTCKLFATDGLSGLGIDFNVFEWDKEDQIGIFLGMFCKCNLVTTSEGLQQLFQFAIKIAEGYFDNPYHSFKHAIDVTYMVYFLVEDVGVGEQLELVLVDKAVLLLSALAHDVLHPGTNNFFQVNSKTPVALKYDGKSVLENQSADFVKKLLHDSTLIEHFNISEAVLKKDRIIERIVDHVLKTDMMYHFGQLDQLLEIADHHLQFIATTNTSMASSNYSLGLESNFISNSASTNFQQARPLSPASTPSAQGPLPPTISASPILSRSQSIQNSNPDVLSSNDSAAHSAMPSMMMSSQHTPKSAVDLFKALYTSPTNNMHESVTSLTSIAPLLCKIILKSGTSKENIMHIILHAADISNPVRPFTICKKWSDLVQDEFIAQGKREIEDRLPLSPNMDPSTINQTQTQLSFTRLIVHPLFESLFELFPRALIFMDLIVDNVRQWGGYELPAAGKFKHEKRKKSSQLGLTGSLSKKGGGADHLGRRLSFAAGTIEIPEALQKLLSKNAKPSRNSLRKASHLEEDSFHEVEEKFVEEQDEEEDDGEEENLQSLTLEEADSEGMQ